MKLFQETTVKLHPFEKLGILSSNLFISLVMFWFGYAGFKVFNGMLAAIGCIGLILMSLMFPIMTYRTVNGKGINNIK